MWLSVVSLLVLLYVQLCLCGLRRRSGSSGSLTTEDSVDVEALRDLNSAQVHRIILMFNKKAVV